MDLSIQRIQLSYNNQEKSTRSRLQRQRVSSKILKPADEAQKSKSRLSCNTKYAKEENAEEAQNEDGSEAIMMTPPLGGPSHMNLVQSEPDSEQLKRIVSQGSKSSSSKSVMAISGKHSRIPSNLPPQDNMPAEFTEMSSPPDCMSDFTPTKTLGMRHIGESKAELEQSNLMSQSASIMIVQAKDSAKSANRLFRERERNDFLIRQQELLERKAAPDANVKDANRAANINLMEGQL